MAEVGVLALVAEEDDRSGQRPVFWRRHGHVLLLLARLLRFEWIDSVLVCRRLDAVFFGASARVAEHVDDPVRLLNLVAARVVLGLGRRLGG